MKIKFYALVLSFIFCLNACAYCNSQDKLSGIKIQLEILKQELNSISTEKKSEKNQMIRTLVKEQVSQIERKINKKLKHSEEKLDALQANLSEATEEESKEIQEKIEMWALSS